MATRRAASSADSETGCGRIFDDEAETCPTRGKSGKNIAGIDRLQHDSTFTTEDAMTLNLSMPNAPFELKPKITVVGVGGAGGNAVNNMIKQNLEGVDFIVANTDAQALAQSLCQRRIQLGTNLTAGLGAGSRPDVGRGAAEEALDEIISQLQGSNMVFITAGMGGGTGTGAAPVIAAATREQGILTVGVVTKPFHFEGLHRMRVAEAGIQELQQFVDTLIIIPNQNLFRIANEKTTFADAFNMADQVLDCGVRGVTDLMVKPGLINLDFADIRAVMTEMGKAMMGTGEAEGPNRAIGAAEAAISNPLLDDVSMKGARGVLINITGGLDMTLFEVDEAANRIRSEVDPEANIIFGSTFDQSLEGKVRISVVATGIEAVAGQMARPVSLSLVTNGGRSMVPGNQAAERHENMTGASQTVASQPAQTIGRRETLGATALAMPSASMAVPMAAPVATPQPQPAMAAPVVAEAPRAMPSQPLVAPQVMVQPAVSQPTPQPVEQRHYVAPPPVETLVATPPAPAQPAPVLTAPVPAAPVQPTAPAQPVAAQPRRAPNLFSRVTGNAASWAKQAVGEPPAAPMTPQLRASAPARPTSAPQAPAPHAMAPQQPPAPTAQPAPQMAAPQPVAQPRLSGLDPKDRLSASRAEEDLLDIPAFLRRQAN
jgi:cell division protein FtsZ